MNSPQISIIIPIYNSEKYLYSCLVSILNQTFPDWECLLVDDGSNDASGTICDDYASKDFRFHVFHKKNGGVSSARNLGLKEAKGEWVTFSDSDDWLEPHTFQTYMEAAKTYSADIVKVGYYFEFENGRRVPKVIEKTMVFDNTWDFHYLLEKSGYISFTWNVCIKRDIIGKRRFREDISWCEDHIFCYDCYFDAHKYVAVDVPCYHYYVRTADNLSSKREAISLSKLSGIERDLKLRLLNGHHEDLILETENTYLERVKVAFYNLYHQNYNYKERMSVSKIIHLYKPTTNSLIKLFLTPYLPFVLKDTLIRFYYRFMTN